MTADPGTEPAASTPVRTWRSTQGAVAALVVAGGTIWRASIVGRGWFSQNDFLVTLPTTSPTETVVTAGFSPGSVAIAQGVANLAPLGWPLAAAVVIALQTVSLLVLWHVLSRLLPDRWLRLPVLTFFAVTPLTLWSTQWWTFALQFWPAALAVLVAVLAVLHTLQRGSTAGPWVAAAGTLAALSTNERWVLAPVVLVGLALAVSAGPSVRDRLRVAVVDHPLMWAAQGVVIAGYAVLRVLVVPAALGDVQSPNELVTAYLRHLGALLPGGPWGSGVVEHAYLAPPSWAVGVGLVVLLAVVALTLTNGGLDARLAWATLAVYALLGLGLLAVQRQGTLAASLDLIHRHGADAALVLTLVVAAALRRTPAPSLSGLPVPRLREAAPRQRELLVAVAAAVALIGSAAVSTPALAAPLLHDDDRAYVDATRAALREDRTAVLLDGGVPPGVLSPWFGDAARVSTVLARAPESPVFDLPSHRLRIVRPDGSLSPVVLTGSVEMEPTDDEACPRPVRLSGAAVPFQRTVPPGRWVLRLGYYTATSGLAVVDVAGQRIEVPVQAGLNAVDVLVTAGFDQVWLSLEHPSDTLCLATATVGVPTASPAGSP
ncbi:MAG TPA: hypothetical protein VES93_09285 [Ornithinibacter sp.]|nr:hypothetical protein [Ornithinibacter sp.]